MVNNVINSPYVCKLVRIFPVTVFSWLIFILRVVHKHFFTYFQFVTDGVNNIDGSLY